MFFSGILVEVTLPYTLKMAGRYYSAEIGRQYIPMLVIFGISGICGLIIVFRLRRMNPVCEKVLFSGRDVDHFICGTIPEIREKRKCG